MNFFDTLLNPDLDEFPNRTIVCNAANLLDIGEFQFLQLAFVHWHGRDMRQDETGAIFDSFMVHSEVPGWAFVICPGYLPVGPDRTTQQCRPCLPPL